MIQNYHNMKTDVMHICLYDMLLNIIILKKIKACIQELKSREGVRGCHTPPPLEKISRKIFH